jgi:hypothetical protein
LFIGEARLAFNLMIRREMFFIFILVILLDRIVRSFQRTSNSTIVKAQTKTQVTFSDALQRLAGYVMWLISLFRQCMSNDSDDQSRLSTLDPTVAAAILAIFIFIMQNKNTFLSTLVN